MNENQKNMKSLIFNWRDELIRIKPEEIVYFEADGNYSKMMLVSKKQQFLSMNLSKVMAKLQEHLGRKSEIFERVGRDLIIRKACLYSIHILQKQLVLTVPGTDVFYDLKVSKEALKTLKEKQAIKQHICVENIQLRELQTRKIYPLSIGDNCFGRKSSTTKCDQMIDNGDSQMSRLHFNIRIHRQNCDCTIVDLGSANGTFLNGIRLNPNEPKPIQAGAIIKAGKTDFLVELVDLDKTQMS